MSQLYGEKTRGPAAPASALEVVNIVQCFIEHVSAGRAAAAAELWDLPALVLGDRHVHGPLAREPLARLFADAGLRGQTASGLGRNVRHAADSLTTRVEWVSERVARLEADWPRHAHAGFLDGVELTTFLLRIDEQGEPKIRALILRTRSDERAPRATS